MELQAIESLIERYLNAETSVTEENELRKYFASGKIAPHLKQYAPLFKYYSLAKEEDFTKRIFFNAQRRKVYSWVAVAASIIILFGVVIQQNSSVHEFGTYEDPDLALQKTKEALEMVSRYMHTGIDDLGYLQEFNNSKNKIVNNP